MNRTLRVLLLLSGLFFAVAGMTACQKTIESRAAAPSAWPSGFEIRWQLRLKSDQDLGILQSGPEQQPGRTG